MCHRASCRCGCAGNERYVANRPGRHPRSNQGVSYETARARIEVWVWISEALDGRDGTPSNCRTRIQVGGTTAIVLTVQPGDGTPGPRFTVHHMNIAKQLPFNDPRAAPAQVERWGSGLGPSCGDAAPIAGRPRVRS